MKRVSVFIVGAAKCGTSTLSSMLDAHSSVVMSDPKEPHYFSANQILENKNFYYKEKIVKSEQEYHACFRHNHTKEDVILGEASVSYFQYDNVAEKIHTYNPHAKIIILLRDPVERAWSHYLMDRRLGYCDVELSDILHDPEKYPEYYRQYIETGQYERHIQRFARVFGKDKLLLDIEDLKNEEDAICRRLCEFIGIEYEPKICNITNKNVFIKPRNSIVARLYAVAEMRKIIRCLLPVRIKRFLQWLLFSRGSKPAIPGEIRERLVEIYGDYDYKKFCRHDSN